MPTRCEQFTTFAQLWQQLPQRFAPAQPLLIHSAPAELVRVESAHTRVAACRHQLDQWGVRPTTHVVIHDAFHPAYLYWVWAIWLQGAVVVPLDPTLPQQRLQRLLGQLKPALILSDKLESATPWPIEPMALPSPAAPPAERPDTPCQPEQLAAILFTSGTTGEPKGICLSHRAMLNSGAAMADGFAWQRGDRLLNLMAFHGMSGLRNPAIAALLAGVTIVLPDPDPNRLLFSGLNLCREQQVTLLATTPALIDRMGQLLPRLSADTLQSLRMVLSCAAPLQRRTAEQLEAQGGLKVREYYGLTESGGICARTPLEAPLPPQDVVGRAWRAELEIRDAQGNRLEVDQMGTLWIRSSQLFSGYLHPGSAVPKQNGWLDTGDLASIDAAGWVTLHGRRDSQFKSSSGEIVIPAEVERMIQAQPGVEQAAVCRYREPHGEERLAAFIVPTAQAAADPHWLSALKQQLSSQLEQSKQPARLIPCPTLPAPGESEINCAQLVERHLHGGG
uniref:Putative o-succinylbenzoate--CoA ligase n=1 Tax=Magnetococcus massalia (strain MO-1) TaxID=451514 RepID=A0A1S7LMF1_MAGMO|nr:putative o-succinylbenzoate--CoA ligase [Candidatus Magnetococcus massalia]